EADILDAPITADEVQAAIKTTKNGKATGPDGLSAGYYKKFREILALRLADAFNHLR
ncbi:Hypothetical predicted protein, partial [Pelobates cultripes]